MQSIGSVIIGQQKFDLNAIKNRIQAAIHSNQITDTTTNTWTDSLSLIEYDCPKCKDQGYIVDGWTAIECECNEQKKIYRLFKSAMIPDEFKEATFQDYRVNNPVNQMLLNSALKYLKEFEEIRNTKYNSLGFIARVGEQRIRELPREKRAEMKRKHNSYGLGKTHLQVAIGKELIKRGIAVLMVTDVSLMDELMSLKMLEDKTMFRDRVHAICTVPVLIWDDIGKAAPTEARKSMYFHIINERYKAQRPILFSSNEDMETLSERIGDAAASRLLGMAYGRLAVVEGPDYRLIKKAKEVV